ncbi:MAG: PAS domain S-box protein, partial [Myxococcota bacterium]
MGDRRILPDESRPSASSADALSASGHASHAQENHESGISRPTEIERALEAADAYGHGTGAPVDESAPVDNAKLRRSAEERLRDSPRTQELNGLEHELRVQQAELEIQNEELREVEQSLEVSRQEFFALYDLAPVGYLTIDEQGLIKRANFTAAELLSADRIRLAGRPLSSYLAEGQTRTFFDHIANVLGAKQSVSCELAFKSQKNNVFFARVTSSPAPPSMSAGAEVFLTIVDISDRILAEEALRDREQRLRAIVDYAPLAIALLDTDDRIIECNEVFERFVERRSDELLHSEFTDFVVDPDLRAFRSMLASGGKSVQPEIRLHPRAREVRAWMTPVDGTRGSGARRLLLMEDISERNRAVERADFLERELVSVHQEKLQALGQLAGGVAHDFNNMLAAIMAFAECALLTDDLPEIIVEDLTGIRDASLRARNLVREVLTFARKRHPVRARVELDKYLQSALGLVRGAAPSHIHFHYEGEPGAAVFIDEGQIEQAIVNVLTNSVQAIGPEEGSIHISVRQTELVDVTQS